MVDTLKEMITMAKKITREEEAHIPTFDNHKEAREWFTIKYGDDFIPAGSEIISDEICYFYYLLLDRATFEAEYRKLQEGRLGDAMAYLKSYQSIEIMSRGGVHIIH